MYIKPRYKAIILIIFLCATFVVSQFLPKKSYKVLKVSKNSMLEIDLNSNGKTDTDEYFKIKDVVLPKVEFSQKTSKFALNNDLTLEEAITSGYVSENYLKYLLEGREITFLEPLLPYSEKYFYRLAKIALNDEDLAKILLKAGLAMPYVGDFMNSLAQIDNKKEIKQTAKEFTSLQLRVVNRKTNTVHRLDCSKNLEILNYEIIPKSLLDKNFVECTNCKVEGSKKELLDTVDKIEKPIARAKSGEIELYLIDPNDYKKPSHRARTAASQAIIKNINFAKKSIDIALYGIEGQEEIFQALINAKARGVKIRAVVDSHPDKADVYSETSRIAKLFDTVYDNSPNLMHNKFFIFDNDVVITGSANISPTGTGGYNSNSVLLIKSNEVAQAYLTEFEKMFCGNFQNTKTKSEKNKFILGKSEVEVYFSPKDKPLEASILPKIQNAKKEILVSAFYLTHYDLINALITARARGVEVYVIIDALGVSNFKKRVELLRQKGVFVKVEDWGGKNHQKNILIDGEIFVCGSANFSQNAYNKNDENTVIIRDLAIGREYRKHFFEMYNSIDIRYLNTYVAPESFNSKNSCYDGVDNDFDGKIDSSDSGCLLINK